MEEDILAVVHILVAAHTAAAEGILAEVDKHAEDYKHAGEVVLASFEMSAQPEQAEQRYYWQGSVGE